MTRPARPRVPTPDRPPSESHLAALLGEAHDAWHALVLRHAGAIGEWRRYTRKSPWVLRVSRGKRPLFYAQPDARAFKVTVLLGARAVEAALAGQVSKRLRASIRKARAYPEGRPVSVVVKKADDLAKVDELVSVKLGASGRPGEVGSRARRPTRRRS